ncbi:hypothetical protein LX64_02356 [Chitinophaga skermanii]|uniref:Uncharacterized protein n=1 Tax=Chitinophaga skermanii TaxID=331697 RepID=A0A327QNG9_9BACT|nr:hypothetical protein [Chitinophaga skermanii]RAJ05202.1 hypothetical protein LX64_02356 [Chitinophaga skermanii]
MQLPYPSFTPIQSEPHALKNNLLLVLMGLCALALLGVSIYVTYLAFTEDWRIAFPAIIITGLLVVMVWGAYRSWQKGYTEIRVDKDGLHFNNTRTGKLVQTIKWSDIAHEPGPYAHDVFIQQRSKSMPRLAWKMKGRPAGRNLCTNSFLGSSLGSIYYTNRYEVMARFLLGLRHFRPDITVSPAVFSHFSIDHQAYTFDASKHWKQEVLGYAMVVVVIVIIYLVVETCHR